MNFKDYSIERPHPPITVWLLSPVIVIGLVVLGIAAFTAFSQVMTSPLQAGFAAALIEISAIVEALSFVRGRNWVGAGGLVASLVISVTYNYIQAATTGRTNGVTNWWQLGTLALGPLAALTFLSLTLGQEMRRHEARVAQWQAGRAAWRKEQAEVHRKEQDRLHQEQLEREEVDRAAQQALELARIEAESRARLARIEAETKEHLARVRAEERERARKERESYLPAAESFRKVSADWRALPQEDRRLIAGMSTDEIVKTYQVSERTARNWRVKAASNGNRKE